MMKTVASAVLAGFMANSCPAFAGVAPIKAMDTCRTEKEALVCGIVSHRGLILYKNACEARAAGANRILQGPCDDTDD